MGNFILGGGEHLPVWMEFTVPLITLTNWHVLSHYTEPGEGAEVGNTAAQQHLGRVPVGGGGARHLLLLHLFRQAGEIPWRTRLALACWDSLTLWSGLIIVIVYLLLYISSVAQLNYHALCWRFMVAVCHNKNLWWVTCGEWMRRPFPVDTIISAYMAKLEQQHNKSHGTFGFPWKVLYWVMYWKYCIMFLTAVDYP